MDASSKKQTAEENIAQVIRMEKRKRRQITEWKSQVNTLADDWELRENIC